MIEFSITDAVETDTERPLNTQLAKDHGNVVIMIHVILLLE